MRIGARLQARFTGQAGKEFTWFALGASPPLLSMDAERAARQIIEAVRASRAEIILTPAGQLVSRAAGLAPGLTSGILHLVQRLTLPATAGRSRNRRRDPRTCAEPDLGQEGLRPPDRPSAGRRRAASTSGPSRYRAPRAARPAVRS